MVSSLCKSDPSIYRLIKLEAARQKEGLEMIPSENHASKAVLEALGSVLTDKYSEGYPKKRYYGGNENVDAVELLAQARAKKLFGVEHVNVQAYSGSPANLAVYLATCRPGDPVMGLNLTDGGHLTHGWKVSATGIFFQSIPYHVKEDGRIDLNEVERLAVQHRPKLIWVGATAYPFQFDYAAFAKIANEVNAYLAADIAHVAGLVVAGVHPDPSPFCHILTTTTHKTLRGPRGALIMVTQKGLEKDPELPEKIDRAVFPGLGGGPHNHQTAAIAVALKEAARPSFKKYGAQVVKNAKRLAESLKEEGLVLVGGGTENHLILIDLSQTTGSGSGVLAQEALGLSGITTNKNTIPGEPSSPFYPSGIRLGTPALTSRGMQEKEMRKIGKWIASAIREVGYSPLPPEKEARNVFLRARRTTLAKNKNLDRIRDAVKKLTRRFPLPALNSNGF